MRCFLLCRNTPCAQFGGFLFPGLSERWKRSPGGQKPFLASLKATTYLEIWPTPVMTDYIGSISQLMEKICKKLKPVCTAVVMKRMLFLPKLWRTAQHKMWHVPSPAAVTQGVWQALSQAAGQIWFFFRAVTDFSLHHILPRSPVVQPQGVQLPRRYLLLRV